MNHKNRYDIKLGYNQILKILFYYDIFFNFLLTSSIIFHNAVLIINAFRNLFILSK